MNLVAIIGNAATQPERRHTASGKAVCNFRIAVSRPGGDTADFFSVVCWERLADVVAEYVTTGRRIAIEGRLAQTSYETKTGEKRSSVEITAHRVQLLGQRSDTDQQQQATPAADTTSSDIPF